MLRELLANFPHLRGPGSFMGSWDQIRRLRQKFVAWQAIPPPGGTGRQGDGPRVPSPESIRTPQEALAYIKLLYQTGRMARLASLLRTQPVFREAWLAVQCFPGMLSRVDKTTLVSGNPVAPGGVDPPSSRLHPLAIPAFEVKEKGSFPPPSFGTPASVSWALSVYKNQEQFFINDQARHPAISLRV